MRGFGVSGSKLAFRMAIISMLFGLQGCAPFMKSPQLWGLDGLQKVFPSGANGRDLDNELISRGFKLSNEMPPHHDAFFDAHSFLPVTCVTSVKWDEDRFGKIASDLKVTEICASL
jgi:hypothetical protein